MPQTKTKTTPTPTPTPKITSQTFFDLGMWLSMPEEHTAHQLRDLLDEDARLPCIALANQYWLVGALTHSLKTSAVWPALDDELTAYLLEMENFYRQRSENIKQETIYVCQLLNDAGIRVALLKGAANVFNGVASPSSIRFMTDIDVLVREEDYQRANHLLRAEGYGLGSAIDDDSDEHWLEALHAPALYREGGACCVEVHRCILKYTASDILDTPTAWKQAIELPLTDALTVWQLEPSHQFILSVAHSEISHNGFDEKVIDLRQLVNASNICQKYGEKIDWPAVDRHFTTCNKQHALYALLYAASALFNRSTPLNSRHDANAEHHLLTCLARYERFQGAKPGARFTRLLSIRRAYNKHNIQVNYGSGSSFWLLKGRMMHLRRHLLMATKIKYWKRLYESLLSA